MVNLSIITATYNRANCIRNLYNSLIIQANKDFEWVIIDDGSTDETETLIDKFIKDNIINIKYYKKPNGGKHTALNLAFKIINSEYTIIVDSDDYLTQTAVNQIITGMNKIKNNKNIIGVTWNKLYKSGEKIVSFPKKLILSDYIEIYETYNVKGDKAEVFKTDIIKNYRFPVIEGENFITEGIVWDLIALKYKSLFVNRGIMICSYREDGLSKSSLKLRAKNHKGATMYYNQNLLIARTYKQRLKSTLNYIRFSLHGNKSCNDIIKNCNRKTLCKILFLLGYLFYLKDKVVLSKM